MDVHCTLGFHVFSPIYLGRCLCQLTLNYLRATPVPLTAYSVSLILIIKRDPVIQIIFISSKRGGNLPLWHL